MVTDSAAHLIAGGVAGTVATILTSPLEVLKTRLQSSIYKVPSNIPNLEYISPKSLNDKTTLPSIKNVSSRMFLPKSKILFLLKHTFETEGTRGLFKGLVPNLIGVAPARAIYFCTYSNAKKYFNTKFKPDSPIVFVLSASSASFITSTATNPVWFIKTRLQLDQSKFSESKLTVLQCIKQTYKSSGIKGFYKGVTASYYGISETAINFLLYESIKKHLFPKNESNTQHHASNHITHSAPENQKGPTSHYTFRFFQLMLSAGVAKTFAATLAYPHEVARTRLREGKSKYQHFWQTLALIAREESYKGLYKGLLTHLLRQIPNTAITLATYETLAYLLTAPTSTKLPPTSPPLTQKQPTRLEYSYKPKEVDKGKLSQTSILPPLNSFEGLLYAPSSNPAPSKTRTPIRENIEIATLDTKMSHQKDDLRYIKIPKLKPGIDIEEEVSIPINEM